MPSASALNRSTVGFAASTVSLITENAREFKRHIKHNVFLTRSVSGGLAPHGSAGVYTNPGIRLAVRSSPVRAEVV